jgi:hypothetical protein
MNNLGNYFWWPIALFLFYLNGTPASAQNRDYLVLVSGDTLYGTVEHINTRSVSPKFHTKVRLTDSKGKQRKFSRKGIAAFKSDGAIYESFWLKQRSRWITIENPVYIMRKRKGEQTFLKLIEKGSLTHYHLEWWEQGESTLMWMDLIKREGDPYFIRATQGIFGLKKNVLTKYFWDCPELVRQIEFKEVTAINQVVAFYNRNCGR